MSMKDQIRKYEEDIKVLEEEYLERQRWIEENKLKANATHYRQWKDLGAHITNMKKELKMAKFFMAQAEKEKEKKKQSRRKKA